MRTSKIQLPILDSVLVFTPPLPSKKYLFYEESKCSFPGLHKLHVDVKAFDYYIPLVHGAKNISDYYCQQRLGHSEPQIKHGKFFILLIRMDSMGDFLNSKNIERVISFSLAEELAGKDALYQKRLINKHLWWRLEFEKKVYLFTAIDNLHVVKIVFRRGIKLKEKVWSEMIDKFCGDLVVVGERVEQDEPLTDKEKSEIYEMYFKCVAEKNG